MTIGIGFLCQDGVLLCCDRQLTNPGGFKYEESKIFRMGSPDWTCLFSYSGEPVAAKVMFQKLIQNLTPELAVVDKSLARFERIIAAVEKIFKNKHAKGLQTLIGLRFPDERCCLCKTDGDRVTLVVTDFIGFGDSSVLRFLDDLLLQECDTLHEAEILGSYVVSVANRYIEGCSGGPDTAMIHNRGMVGESSFIFPNQEERFAHCESEIGKELTALLISGGLKGREKP